MFGYKTRFVFLRSTVLTREKKRDRLIKNRSKMTDMVKFTGPRRVRTPSYYNALITIII